MSKIVLEATEAERVAWASLRIAELQRGKAFVSKAGAVALEGAVPFLEMLGSTLWDKMAELAELIERHRRVSVVGANSTSKDYTLARLALWWETKWAAENEDAKVIITGPTNRQVTEVVWREFRTGLISSKYPLGGFLMPKAPHWELTNERFATGFVSRDYDSSGYGIQGFHSPHLMVIITEAQSVEQDVINALKRLNPERIILSGNPLSVSGELYEAHHELNPLYETMSISAFDTPNVREGRVVIPGMVTLEDVEERKREWGEDSPLYVASVLGQWPVNLGGGIVPLLQATEAAKRDLVAGRPRIIACDVASRGADKTVVMRRDGPVARIIKREAYTDNIIDLAQWLKEYLADNEVDALVIDGTGLGTGVVDWLWREGVPAVDFKGGSSAHDPTRYVNLNAEAWWRMRQAFMDDMIDIENDAALINQITSREYTIEGDKRIRLKSKDQMSHSPDEADALAMTFWSEVRQHRSIRNPIVLKKEDRVAVPRRERIPVIIRKHRG